MSVYQDSGSIWFRFRDPDGYYRTNNFVPILGVAGDSDNVAPIFPEIFVPPSGQMLFDFRNVNVTLFATFMIVLRGVRRRKVGGTLCETKTNQPGGGGAYGGDYPGGGSSGGGYPPAVSAGGSGLVLPAGAGGNAGGVVMPGGAGGAGSGWPGSGGL